MDDESVDDVREVDEEVNQDKNSEADGMNLEVDSKDEVMHIISMSDL